MPLVTFSNNKYSYRHHDKKGPFQAIDIHDIFIPKSRVRVLFSYLGTILILANICYMLVMQEILCTSSIMSMGFLFATSLQRKTVQKESVIIMPAFGVQLETHFWSGKVARRFVPIGKILRPVLNECVTPVTCYWNLALMLREQEELLLVFKGLKPPVSMLVPIWTALCATTDRKEESND